MVPLVQNRGQGKAKQWTATKKAKIILLAGNMVSTIDLYIINVYYSTPNYKKTVKKVLLQQGNGSAHTSVGATYNWIELAYNHRIL